MKKIIKNIPNMITISRMIASILGAGLFLTNNLAGALLFYIYGGVSDFLDGHMAKKLNAYSELGRKLDAISDKIYALSLTLPAILCGNLLMLIPLILETSIAYINFKAEKSGHKVYTKRIGKFKTASLFPTMITGLLASRFIAFYLLFIPILEYSTSLQLKTKEAYQNEEYEEENIKKVETAIEKNVGVEHSDIPLKDKIKYLYQELAFLENYTYDDNVIPNVKTRKR